MDWVKFDQARPADMPMVIYYVGPARYVWGTGGDYDTIKVEYPTVSHWAIFTAPPDR